MKKNIIVGITSNTNRNRYYIGVLRLMPLGFLVAFLFFSCSKEEDPVLDITTANCSTAVKTNISFSKDVYPIIQSNCLSCHDSKNHSGGIVIEDFKQIAESARIGELMNSIKSLNGNPPYMPKGGRLTDCQIATIQNWIIQGINNN